MDFSWTNINSINNVFNGLTILQYLNLTYDLLIEHKNESQNIFNIIRSMVYICSTHFLKIIIKRVSFVDEKFEKKLKKSFDYKNKMKICIFFFTLLQNSTSIDQFNILLEHLYNIYMVKQKSISNLNSIKILLDAVSNRNYLDELTNKIDFDKDNLLDQKLLEEKQFVVSDIAYENIKISSPFTGYYNSLEKTFQCYMLDNIHDYNENLISLNEFFCPKYYKILTSYLHILPLWTGILLNKFSEYHSIFSCDGNSLNRLVNNPVENLFGQEKHSLLKNQQKVMPSEFIGPEAKWIMSIFYENYFDDEFENETFKRNISNKTEKWMDKTQKKKRKKGSLSFQ